MVLGGRGPAMTTTMRLRTLVEEFRHRWGQIFEMVVVMVVTQMMATMPPIRIGQRMLPRTARTVQKPAYRRTGVITENWLSFSAAGHTKLNSKRTKLTTQTLMVAPEILTISFHSLEGHYQQMTQDKSPR